MVMVHHWDCRQLTNPYGIGATVALARARAAAPWRCVSAALLRNRQQLDRYPLRQDLSRSVSMGTFVEPSIAPRSCSSAAPTATTSTTRAGRMRERSGHRWLTLAWVARKRRIS